VELQRDLHRLQDAGINLVTITYDSQEVLKKFADAFDIRFTMLSDEGSSVIKRFDLLNPVGEWGLESGIDSDPALKELFNTYVSVTAPNAIFVGIAFPGTFMLDPRGIVRERHFEDFYIERNTIASVLLRIGKDVPPVAATRVTTPQLNLTAYTSDEEVAVGSRFALVMEVEPVADMHIYAPGASEYQAISLNLDPNPYVRLLPMDYPESEPYYFQPLDETVPVYKKPIRLLQEIVLDGSAATQSALRGQEQLTLTGQLAYQACDERLCYPPKSIPLSFSLKLRGLVFRLPALK
jgi:peroxiredoxin